MLVLRKCLSWRLADSRCQTSGQSILSHLFEYGEANRLKTTKLVNLKNHQYKLEPNVHFSPDDRWIIFRANFEGVENVYAVEL